MQWASIPRPHARQTAACSVAWRLTWWHSKRHYEIAVAGSTKGWDDGRRHLGQWKQNSRLIFTRSTYVAHQRSVRDCASSGSSRRMPHCPSRVRPRGVHTRLTSAPQAAPAGFLTISGLLFRFVAQPTYQVTSHNEPHRLQLLTFAQKFFFIFSPRSHFRKSAFTPVLPMPMRQPHAVFTPCRRSLVAISRHLVCRSSSLCRRDGIPNSAIFVPPERFRTFLGFSSCATDK